MGKRLAGWKVTTSMTVSEAILEAMRVEAKAQDRTVSVLIERVMAAYLKQRAEKKDDVESKK